MEFRSNLSRARGLGSSNEGTKHWWAQRITGIALIPLMIWFLFAIVSLVNANFVQFQTWLSSNANPALLALLISFMFYHGQLGIQVIIEDYIASTRIKLFAILFTKFTVIVLGSCSIFVIIKLSFGSY